MLHVINRQENCQNINAKEGYFLSYDEHDLCNSYTSKKEDKADRFSISFPRHCVLGYIILDTNPFNEVDSRKEVVQSFNISRSVDPRRSNLPCPGTSLEGRGLVISDNSNYSIR